MPSFAEALYAMSTESLRSIVRIRGVDSRRLALVPDKRSLVLHIAGELNKQSSVSAAIQKCNARELRLLQLATSIENARGFTWSRLMDMAGGPAIEPALSSVMDRLEELGLAYRVGPSIFIPDMVRNIVPASLSDRYTASRLLSIYDAPAIRIIVEKLGLDQEYTTKNSNIEAIRTHLLASLANLRLNPPLSDSELSVIEFLIQMGGSATPIEVANVVLDGRTDDFFRYEWQNRWKQGKERNAVDSLLARGIVYVTTSGYGYNFYIVIPGDLLLALTGAKSAGFWTEPAPIPTPVETSIIQSRRHQSVLRDIVCMLSFFAVQNAARTNTGHIHKSSLKAIARMLSIADEQYATFLYAIARDAGLAAPEGDRQSYALTSVGNDWLHYDSATQLGVLFNSWRSGLSWAEMYHEPLMRNNEYRHRDMAQVARHSVLQVLAEMAPSDACISLESIVTVLTFRCPLLLSECAGLTPGLVTSLSVFVRQLITVSLYWLGLVEIGVKKSNSTNGALTLDRTEPSLRSSNADVVSFRITPQGEAMLRSEKLGIAEREPREDKFLVQANAEVFVPPFLEPWILYRLLMLTEVPAKGAAGATINLTRESIRRAFDLGETPQAMLEFLQTHSRTTVPQNVEYLINEVGGKHGHIRVGRAEMYLQVDSPMLMKELQARRELKGYFVRALTDNVAVLKGDDVEKVLKDLRKAGYLPVSDEGPAARSLIASTPPIRPVPQTPVNGMYANTSNRSGKAGPVKNQDTQSSVDWDRIAREDGKPWHVQSALVSGSLDKPPGAYDNPSLIRVMLHNACITHNIVDLLWREIGQEPVRVLFEPVSMVGNTVRGYSQHDDEPLNLELEMIIWARLTPDRY